MSRLSFDPVIAAGSPGPVAPESGPAHHASMDTRFARLEVSTEYLRHDLGNLRLEVRQLGSDLRDEIKEVRNELRGAIQDLRTEVKKDIQDLRTELKGDMQELRTELKGDMQELRTELRGDMKDLRTDIREIRSDFKLLLGALVTVALGLSGLMAKGFHWI
jgi:gas vesicle protein